MTSPISDPKRFAGTHDDVSAALTLEAMRLGVVPTAEVGAYTVGREQELSLVQADLRTATERGGALRAFLGDYGTGKTHLLELIQSRALHEGFCVARVTLDPRESTPSHPKRIYRGLVRSLRYPDQPSVQDAGLRPLLAKAWANPEVQARFSMDRGLGDRPERALQAGAHLYLTPALRLYRAIVDPEVRRARYRNASDADLEDAVEALLNWLEGHPTLSNQELEGTLHRLLGRQDRVYSLIDFRPWARIYAYLLNGLSLLARLAGYRGLAILLDEAEFYALLSPTNRYYAGNLFRALAQAAWTPPEGSEGPEDQLPFSDDEVGQGGMGVQRKLRPRYDASAGLYVVFAMTPNPEGVEVLERCVPRGQIAELGTLTRAHYQDLATRVCDFYASARPEWALPGPMVAPLGKVVAGLLGSGQVDNPRQAMKLVIDLLDVARFNRPAMPRVLQDLNERLAF